MRNTVNVYLGDNSCIGNMREIKNAIDILSEGSTHLKVDYAIKCLNDCLFKEVDILDSHYRPMTREAYNRLLKLASEAYLESVKGETEAKEGGEK